MGEAKSYNIGELTMKHVFRANGIENVANLQEVLDAVERALQPLGQPKPYSPYVDGKFVP